jgi:dolichol-phosphate mannosyltransferase
LTTSPAQRRTRVSVVLPTYDEALNISDLVDEIRQALKDHELEVLVVDDDSPDGTWRIVEEKARTTPGLRLIRRTNERGLTSAISEGIRRARGDVVCWMDCDFSMPPSVLPRLVAKITQGYDLAVGSRYVEGGRDARDDTGMRVLASRVITRLSSLLLVRDFYDYTSGFVAARRSVFEQLALRGDYGEYFIDLVFRAHRLGFRIVEIPYECVPRRRGTSKTEAGFFGFFRHGIKYLLVVARLRWEALRRPTPSGSVSSASPASTFDD